jgi:hypothetical protein
LLVLPRLVISDQPAGRTDEPDRLAEQTIAELKQVERGGQARVRRTSSTKQMVDGVIVTEVEAEYAVLDPKGDRDVVHRVLIALRDVPGDPRVVTITATYLAIDEEWLGTEVDRMLRSVHFTDPGASPDAGATPRASVR